MGGENEESTAWILCRVRCMGAGVPSQERRRKLLAQGARRTGKGQSKEGACEMAHAAARMTPCRLGEEHLAREIVPAAVPSAAGMARSMGTGIVVRGLTCNLPCQRSIRQLAQDPAALLLIQVSANVP